MDINMDMETETVEYIAESRHGGQRLDVFLAEVSGCSRSRIRKLIEEGRTALNGSAAKPRQKVTAGDTVSLRMEAPKAADVRPENIPLDILYQDRAVAVVNKARGIAVHPGAGRGSGTVVNGLLHHLQDLSGIGGIERPGIVHRLDMDTSGLLLVAKNDAAHENLSRQFEARNIKKEYLAIVHGRVKTQKGQIIAPIGRHPQDRKKMAVAERGRYAHTLWELEALYEKYSLLRVEILTGRTHQIRVHLTSCGYPILGDRVYGNRSNPWNLQRQMLHARKIRFIHPETGDPMEFTAEIPEDMLRILAELKHT